MTVAKPWVHWQANGTAEAVYGEFKAFELSNSDLSATKQRVRGGGTSRAARGVQNSSAYIVEQMYKSGLFFVHFLEAH